MALDAVLDRTANVHESLREELLDGLLADEKFINPKFFYDELGSSLFAEICTLPEYYPTRTEVSIYREHDDNIAASVGRGRVLVEPGAGACEKVRHLVSALEPASYVPIDISGDFLQEAVADLREEFPALPVHPVAADFNEELELPPLQDSAPPLLFYPGSTIGNFTPEQAAEFLSRTAERLGSGSGLLIGYDLHKDSETLTAAYNDARGVTARFNRNILTHANNLLGTEFKTDAFDHLAFYNEDNQRIEMHLVSRDAQTLSCGDHDIEFTAGERIHTEYSYKYTVADFSDLADRAGYRSHEHWTDPQEWFAVHYLEAA